jgi:hypothetical protein
MVDKNLVRGLFLTAIALAFGLTSLNYSVGKFSNAGPGLFPLIVSSLLLMVGVSTIIRSRFDEKKPLDFNLRNISIILGSLGGFALVSHFINMVAGIVTLVFLSGFAAREYSIPRNLKIAAGLIAVAFGFQKLLGLNLPLI